MTVGRIGVEPENDILVLALYGEHDLSTAPELRTEVDRAIGAGGHVIVDLSEAEFIDSSILGVLVAGYRAATGEAGDGSRFVAVAVPGGLVTRLFDLVAISDLIPVYPTRTEALAALNGSTG